MLKNCGAGKKLSAPRVVQIRNPQCGAGKRLSAPQLALFDIALSNIDCRYIDTFEKYRYRYGHLGKYRYR